MLYSSAILITGALSSSYVLSNMFPDCKTAVNWVVFFMSLIIILIILAIAFEYYQRDAKPVATTGAATPDTGNYDPAPLQKFFTSDPINSWRATDPVAYDYCLKLLTSKITDARKNEILDTFSVFAYKPGYDAYAIQLEALFWKHVIDFFGDQK